MAENTNSTEAKIKDLNEKADKLEHDIKILRQVLGHLNHDFTRFKRETYNK